MVCKKMRSLAGFTLVELLIVIAIMASISIYYFETRTVEMQNDMAKVTANRLVQYNNAVTTYIFDNYDGFTDQVNGLPAVGIVPLGVAQVNTAWLKDSVGCAGGLASKAYLPCGFSDDVGFNLMYRTTVTLCPALASASLNNWCSSPQAPLALDERFVFDGTSTIEPIGPIPAGCRARDLCLGGKDRLDLASQIIALANNNSGPTGFEGYSNISHFEYTDGTFNPIPAFNVITARVSNTAANDPWLRTDGTNYMQGDIRMGGIDGAGVYSEYDITNTRNLSASGNLYLDSTQDETGLATTAADGGGNIITSGYINTGVIASNTLAAIESVVSPVGSVAGDIFAENDLLVLGDVTLGDIATGSNGNLIVMGDSEFGSSAFGNGNIDAFGDVYLGDPSDGSGGDLVALGDATFGYYGAGTAAGTTGVHQSGGYIVFQDGYLDAMELNVSAGTYWVSIVDNGAIIPKDPVTGGAALTCTAPDTAKLYLSPVMYSRDNSGGPLGAVQTWAIDNGANWTAKLRVLTPSGWFEPSGDYGKLQAIVKCG